MVVSVKMPRVFLHPHTDLTVFCIYFERVFPIFLYLMVCFGDGTMLFSLFQHKLTYDIRELAYFSSYLSNSIDKISISSLLRSR